MVVWFPSMYCMYIGDIGEAFIYHILFRANEAMQGVDHFYNAMREGDIRQRFDHRCSKALRRKSAVD